MRKKPEWIRLRRSAKWCYTSGALLGGLEGGSVLPFFEAHDGHPAMEQVVPDRGIAGLQGQPLDQCPVRVNTWA